MKRAVLALPVLIAILTVGYGYAVSRREHQYRQLVVQGDLALARGETVAAVSAFGEAIALKPESMLAYLKRGDAHRRHGELEAAARDLETAQGLNPTEPRALELLGDVAMARQLHERAADYYSAYIKLDDRPRVLYKLGLARHLAGQHVHAADALRQSVKADARFAEAHYLLGVCLRATKQLRGAQAAFERALAISPSLVQAREQLAEVYGLLGRRPERIKQLEEALQADPSAARQVTLARAYAEAGQVPRAIRMLRVAADLYPSHAGTYVALGRVWLDAAATGDRVAVSKAIEALQHAVSMEASSEALTLLGQARLLASDPVGAERLFRQATETLPAEPAAFLHLADAAERIGHSQIAYRALIDYQALTAEKDPDVLVRVAHAQWQSGDPAAARSTLARALEKDPGNQAARDLERRLPLTPAR